MTKSDENSVQKKHSRTLHCPDCDSVNIYVPTGGYTGNYYRCKDCGYEGALVIEHDDEDFSGEKSAKEISPAKIPGDSRSLTAGFIVLLILAALFFLIVILGLLGVF